MVVGKTLWEVGDENLEYRVIGMGVCKFLYTSENK
jgi:hypothetical protein